MEKMRPGDILLFRGETGFSKIISWLTGSEYTHVAVCISDSMSLAIEAISGGGVRARDIRQIKNPYDVFRVKLTYIYSLDKTISFLVSHLNRRYDYLGVAYLGILKILGLRSKANAWQREKDYFCSELCAQAFLAGGLSIVPQVPDAAIAAPSDIAQSTILVQISKN